MPTISQLPAATTVDANDLFAIVQSGITKKATASLVLTFVSSGLTVTMSQVTGLTAALDSKLAIAANLSDLANVITARTNLGLGTAALINVPVTAPNGGTGVASPTQYTMPVAQGAAAYTFIGPLTDGQLLIGSTGNNPVPASLTAGPGVSISGASGTITISATGSGIGWTDVSGTSQAMVANGGYVANNGGLVTLTMPATAAFGSVISVVGYGAGGWLIAQNAGQTIHVGSVATTTGGVGSVASTNRYDSIDLICTVANTEWVALGGPQGVLTIV